MGVREDCVGYASFDNRLFPFMHADFLHMSHRETFFPRDSIPTFPIAKKNHEDINLQAREAGFSEVSQTESVCDMTSLCVHPITSAIHDNIYQQTFDPPQNLSCKFRELISRTRDAKHTITEAAVARGSQPALDMIISPPCFSWRILISRSCFIFWGDYT